VEREISEPFLRRVERRVALEEGVVDDQVRQICVAATSWPRRETGAEMAWSAGRPA
jgi:hypothetical protein